MCGALALAPPALLTRRSRCRRDAAASSQRERRPLRHGSPLRLAAVLVHVYVYVHVRTVRLYRVMPRRCGASPLHSLSIRMRCVCGRSACLHVSHVRPAPLWGFYAAPRGDPAVRSGLQTMPRPTRRRARRPRAALDQGPGALGCSRCRRRSRCLHTRRIRRPMPRPPRGGALALAPPPLLSLPVLRWPAHAAMWRA